MSLSQSIYGLGFETYLPLSPNKNSQNKEYNKTGISRGVVVNVLHYNIIVSEFELRSQYHI